MDRTFYPYKTFSQTAHDAHDLPVRLAVSGMLTHSYGWQVYSSGQYDVDFSARRPDGSIAHPEVEQRTFRGWTGEFPFPTVELPLRKRELLADPFVVFVVANWDLSRWVAIPGPVVLAYGETVDKPTRYGTDRFISIPVEYARQGSF